MAEANPMGYKDPVGGTDSTIGSQIRSDHFIKQALIEARKSQYFMQLADTTNLPKHMGKKIKKYHYLPILDDANINDQGIDAAGATANGTVTYKLLPPGVSEATNGMNVIFIVGEGANLAAAETDAESQAKLESAVQNAGYDVVTWNTNWDTTIDDYQAAGWQVTDASNAELGAYGGFVPESGNLYGSSKDPGYITSKLPALTENGGRVNRVGFKRVEIEGSIEKFGFFDEYTQESLDFDSDADLAMHINREMINAAHEITEDALQIDLLNGAGVLRYAGTAVSDATVAASHIVDYNDLVKLSIMLDDNRTPKQTQVVTGTRNIDTKTIPAARVLYCGSELQVTLMDMVDYNAAPAFIPVQQYAAGTTVLNGEIGTVGYFRIVIVPEMMKWEGAGAAGDNSTYETDGNVDVFPMLVVGSGAFSTIGFQTDGKTVKFKITHKKPGYETADRNDPYGELGFMSIKWYYGFLLQRPERIGLVKTAAKLNA